MHPTRLILIPALAALAASAAAAPKPARPSCSISYEAPADLTETIQAERFTFDGYDAFCALLDREGLAIDIVSGDGVLQERAFGWASIRLVRMATRVYGSRSRAVTTLSREATTPEARRLTLQSTNSVLRDIASDADSFVRSVAEEEARLRRVLAPPSPPPAAPAR